MACVGVFSPAGLSGVKNTGSCLLGLGDTALPVAMGAVGRLSNTGVTIGGVGGSEAGGKISIKPALTG